MEKLLRSQIRELEQKAEQLSALCKASKEISSSFDFEEVLAVGLDSILLAIKADGGSIMLLDEETGSLVIKMFRRLSEKVVQNVSCKLDEGIVSRVVETGEPLLLVNDKVKPELKPLIKRRDIRSSIIMPLKVKERVIGILNINKTSSYTFNQDDLGLISVLAGQLAAAIENAKLYEIVQQDKKELDAKVFNLFALFEASQALGPLLDIEEILKLAIDMFDELIRTDCGLIMTLEEETGEFVARAAKRLSKDFMDQAKLEITEHEIQQMLQLEGPVLVADADSKLKDYCPALYQKLTQIGIELCIPLATRDRLIGLVALGKKLIGSGFSSSDLEFLSTLARQVANSLENARLVEAMHKWGEELERKVKERTSELEEKTKELEQANIQMKKLDQLKGMFIANMSHELRSPMNSIIGFTGIMLQGMAGEINDEQRKQLTMVKNSANHLLSLINDILDVSKIEAGKVELFPEEFSLKDVVREVVEIILPRANKKSLELITDMPEAIMIISDKKRLKQVLLNLVTNAVKFTDQGSVKIAARISNKRLKIRVIDTGMGIKKEDMNKLFAPFQQIDVSSAKSHEGTGLGLHLSRKLIELMRGDISAKSEYGRGSEFLLTIPLIIKEDR